ncbi:MAG: DUF4157 domain-containing protein [Moorea sp. SIO3B2]|nr:DUF4157 domain-containing protein [Moorena sp. SIO3B2]
MRTLESGQYQPETGRREIGLQGKLSFGQSGERTRQGANHGGQMVVQPKRMMVQRAAQPLTGDSLTDGDSMRAVSSKNENKTGLPDRLKAGIENLSGYSMDDVRVHYNSDKPAQLQALAYAQGKDIHVGPGQEKHLPHEAWHVVQQKQGRVKPTIMKKGGVKINEEKGLEEEADLMGAKVIQPNVQKTSPMEKYVSPKAVVITKESISPPLQLLPAHVTGLLERAAKTDRNMKVAQTRVGAVSQRLKSGNVPHRIGGSMAARLQGGKRTPKDVDIEVQNEYMLEMAKYRMLGWHGSRIIISGSEALVSARVERDIRGFLTTLEIGFELDNNRWLDKFEVDIVNENNDDFTKDQVPPHQRVAPSQFGVLLSPIELVMNYVDRYKRDSKLSEEKQDRTQIKKLLSKAYGVTHIKKKNIDLFGDMHRVAKRDKYVSYLKDLAMMLNK